MSVPHESNEPVLERNSLVGVILLTIVTFGFYAPIWFLRRRRWLDRLTSPVKIGLIQPLLLLALQVASFAIGVMSVPYRDAGLPIPASLALPRLAMSFGYLLLLFKLAYTVREILSDHLKKALSALSWHPAQYLVELSGIMTLLFSIWYLQYKINECAALSEQWTAAARAEAMA